MLESSRRGAGLLHRCGRSERLRSRFATHGIDLSEEKAKGIVGGLVGTMPELKHIAMAKVQPVSQFNGRFKAATLPTADFAPNTILGSGTTEQAILLAAAAETTASESDDSVVDRPTCAAIPAVIKSRSTATNLAWLHRQSGINLTRQ